MATRELAILVTARNMASGVLNDVRGDIKGIQSEAKRGAQMTARNLAIGGVAAAGFLAVQVKAGIDSLAALERQQAQTNAVIESTQGIAGVSAQNVRDLAEEYENLTTVDDKAIQGAENMLLTFTNVRKEAFEPALEAILNLNTAMGGDEDSLDERAIMVGKALNDPIRGLTALRRVGIQFTAAQEDQIKALAESGDMLGAQTVILGELERQFGGSAAAAADTFEGKMKRVGDAVEDAQMSLATAFLPVLEKAADKLGTFLSDPDTQAAIEDLGEGLADAFDTALGIIEKIPWDAVGSTFSLMGQGAKVVLDMFASMPPWVQTAILTGWGLNKLTGGALGNIVGMLGSGLIKGVLGMNAGVVNINAAVVNGGAPGAPGGGGGGLGGRIAGGVALATGVGLAVTAGVMTVDFVGKAQQGVADLNDQMDALPRQTADELDDSIARVESAIDAANDGPLSTLVSQGTGLDQRLRSELAELQNQRSILDRGANAARDAIPWAQRIAAETGETSRRTGNVSSAVAGQTGILSQIRDKPPPRVTVNVANNVSINNWSRVQQSSQYAYSSLDRGI